jgi:hypothetical protein
LSPVGRKNWLKTLDEINLRERQEQWIQH